MKIKQVGNSTESENRNQKIKTDKQKSSRILLYAVISITVLICLVLIYVFVINKKTSSEKDGSSITQTTEQNNSNQPSQTDDLKKKELDLKERELKLKEQQLNTDETEVIRNRLNSWNSELINKSSDVSSYYADNVDYYSWGNTSKSKLMEDKRSFFKKWDRISLNLENVSISRQSGSKYICTYDKSFSCDNFSNGKSYSAKVASKLVFEKLEGQWKITEENDYKTYFLNKNW